MRHARPPMASQSEATARRNPRPFNSILGYPRLNKPLPWRDAMNTESTTVAPQLAPVQPHQRGGTLLLVEDSRLTADYIRLLFRGAAGRLRRADCLLSARRHIALYTPDAAIIDLGLPDGSGLDLISEMARRLPRTKLIIATSGDPDREEDALLAGGRPLLAQTLRHGGAICADAGPGLSRAAPRNKGRTAANTCRAARRSVSGTRPAEWRECATCLCRAIHRNNWPA